MGWSLGYDNRWKRDIGYGVPAVCDEPKCEEEIDRGLSYVCGSEPYGGEYGCGLYFCHKNDHLPCWRKPRGSDRTIQLCKRCMQYRGPYKAKDDTPEWMRWKLRDSSWYEWRKEHIEDVADIRRKLKEQKPLLYGRK